MEETVNLKDLKLPRHYGATIAEKLNCTPRRVWDVKTGTIIDEEIECEIMEMALEFALKKQELNKRREKVTQLLLDL